MMNKNKNMAMYLDLTDEEIKQYTEGGYIVEELNEMHEGGEPGHSHLLDNPFKVQSSISGLDLTLESNLDELNREHRQKLLQIKMDADAIDWQKGEDAKLKPKTTSKKYKLIKPSEYLRERELTSYAEKQVNRILNSAVALSPQQIADMRLLSKQDPKAFLKDYTNEYPVLNQNSGVYSIYPAQEIRDRIYNNGLSARKISEDLGIDTKDNIEKYFKTTFDTWQSDYDYNIKTAINKYIDEGLSREQAVDRLVKSGAADRKGVERVFNTSLDILETKKWESDFLNKTIPEQYEEIEKIIESGKTFKNTAIQGNVDKMIEAYNQQKELKKQAEDAIKFGEQLKAAEQYHNQYIMGNTDTETGALSYTIRENEGAQNALALRDADVGIYTSLTDKFGYTPSIEVQQENINQAEWVANDIKNQIRKELETENRIYKGAKRNGREFRERSSDEIDQLVAERFENLKKRDGFNPSSKMFREKYFNGEIGGFSSGQSKALEYRGHKIENAKRSTNNNAIEQLNDQILELEKNPSQYINGKLKSDLIKELQDKQQEFRNANTDLRASVKELDVTGTLLDPKFRGEASLADKIFNPGAYLQYNRLDIPMPSNFGQYKKLQEEQKQLTGSYSNDAALAADDRNTVGKAINIGLGFTPAGLIYHGAEGARNLVQVDLPEIMDKGLTWETGLPAGINLFSTLLGATAARTGLKKGFDYLAPNVTTGSIKGIQDDILKETLEKSITNPGLISRTGTLIDDALTQSPGIISAPYKAVKSMGKDIIKMDEEYIPNFPLSNLISDTRRSVTLAKDILADKNVQTGLTGYGLLQVPGIVKSGVENIQEEDYTGLGIDAVDLGLAFAPGFIFKNTGSTLKTGENLLRKGVTGEIDAFKKGVTGLTKFGSREGTRLQKTLGYGTDAAKAGYHGSVLYGIPGATLAATDLLLDDDATSQETLENISKVSSVLPGLPGYNQSKYIFMGGTQAASDPTNPENLIQGGLEASGIGRYGKLGNYAGKTVAKIEEATSKSNDANIPDTNEVIKEQRGGQRESVELYLDDDAIQQYLLGGYIVEEI